MASNLLDKKLDYWEHQLLDLGKRNKMINYRETKRTTLKLVEPGFSELFRRIAVEEETLTFQRSVDRETDIRVFSILSLLEHLSSPLPVTIGDIKAEGSVLERQRTLKNMRAKSRLAQEEQGTNILYLSFGFIEWKDGKGASAQWIKSPLVLVPTVLALEALNSPYTLSKHEDDIVVNPTLEYYLKTEYGIELPHYDADKETLDDYLTQLEEIADQRGWRIIREVSLGLLSFMKISMYNDLKRSEDRIKKNPVIRAMSGDYEAVNAIPEHLQTFDLDTIRPQDCYQVMSADSSQQDAILYSKNGISFVMQGPPGTGKSQTITNIIAEALADGKKVLFVSEKMAALQVVYKRLQEAHLADFCLPLHSYKANKKEILEQIGANLKLKQTVVHEKALADLEDLLSIRRELNNYANELHQINDELHISCYEAYNNLEEVCDAPSIIFSLTNPLSVTQSQLQAYLNLLKEYALAVQRLGYFVKQNPWEGLSARTSGYEYSEHMKSELLSVQKFLREINGALASIEENSTLENQLTYGTTHDFSSVLKAVAELPEIPDAWMSADNLEKLFANAQQGAELFKEISTLKNQIAEVFNESVYAFPYTEWICTLDTLIEALTAVPLISSEASNFNIAQHMQLRDTLKNIQELLRKEKEVFWAMNTLLGTDFAVSVGSLETIQHVFEAVSHNIEVPQHWFKSDIRAIKELAKQAKTISLELNETRNQLLSSWENDILELDYEPILMRYKTDYTSIWKVFNSQYKEDKRKIQGLSRSILKKLPDDTVIGLLSTLKIYHEKEAWFSDNKEQLTTMLGAYFVGERSNWDIILTAINVVEQLNCLPIGSISSELTAQLSSNHADFISRLQKHIASAAEIFNQIQSICDENNIKLYAKDSTFNLSATMESINGCYDLVCKISEHWAHILPASTNACPAVCDTREAIQKLEILDSKKQMLSVMESTLFVQNFGLMYTGEHTNWDEIVGILHKFDGIRKHKLYSIAKAYLNASEQNRVTYLQAVSAVNSLYEQWSDSFNWVNSQFTADTNLSGLPLGCLLEKINGCIEHITLLEKWIDYQEAKEDCVNQELGDFLVKAENAGIYTNVDRCFLKGFYHMWLGAVCDHSAAVRRFRKNTHDERIQKFIELDDLQLLIAQMRIREKLIANLPTSHRLLKATDEVAILNKELSKKRNIMPLRKLFKQIPNLLMKLKPCLMMSPLSVSYFLETEAYHFDLVIFDEASQIFPEDAIGAIFRGSQVIIAGDSKQLPPTSFFAKTTNNIDGDYDIEDEDDYDEIISDSILEESAAVLPNRTLLWHYRSKAESLIAFSNREIYKNSLITFPNSTNSVADMGVEYVFLPHGRYEGNKKNRNVAEAQECARLVIEHIKRHPNRSLGIIAFSEKQQSTIEDAITDIRERSPEYEWFFDDSKDEPFFVKNLENVQGDERDTIICSICYAKNEQGHMNMFFGPISKNGGERRLNVAFTRAKCNLKLVGSILPSDIDLDRAKSEGARVLRSYIEFAQKGVDVLRPVKNEEAFTSNDAFCNVVADFLERKGYVVKRQIGCSDYKIDIAIENPNREGEYIAGIECDGLSYIQAKTARDRDHLRKSVLQNMGWNLYRVWSTEWSRNPEAEKKALLDFIQSAYGKNGEVIHSFKQSNEDTAEHSIDEIASETTKKTTLESLSNPYHFSYYKEAKWWEARHGSTSDNLTRISETIIHVTSIEQPIHLDLLYKRVGQSFTTGKATEAVKNTIDQAIEKKLRGRVVIDKDLFVRMLPLGEIVVRIPEGYDTPRPMEYIHTEEVGAAMLQIIKHSFGMTTDDLATECARVFGYERKGPKIKAKTDAALNYLVDSGKVKIIDSKVQLI